MLVDAKGTLKVSDSDGVKLSEAVSLAIQDATEIVYAQRVIAAGATVTIDETIDATLVYISSDVDITLFLEGEASGHVMTFFLASGTFAAGITVAATEDATITVIAAK